MNITQERFRKIVTNDAGAYLSQVAVISAAIFTLIWFSSSAMAQGQSRSSISTKKETNKMSSARGEFDVKTIPQKIDNKEAEEAKLSRMSLDKQFHGGLEGTSKGEMIYTGTEVEGSGVYVALERITGTLG